MEAWGSFDLGKRLPGDLLGKVTAIQQGTFWFPRAFILAMKVVNKNGISAFFLKERPAEYPTLPLPLPGHTGHDGRQSAQLGCRGSRPALH